MSRYLIAAVLWLAVAAAACAGSHAEEGCPTGQLPDALQKKCIPVSKYNTLPLDDQAPMRFEALQVSRMIYWLQGTGVITKDTPTELDRKSVV